MVLSTLKSHTLFVCNSIEAQQIDTLLPIKDRQLAIRTASFTHVVVILYLQMNQSSF
jgi:hypothetical protein